MHAQSGNLGEFLSHGRVLQIRILFLILALSLAGLFRQLSANACRLVLGGRGLTGGLFRTGILCPCLLRGSLIRWMRRSLALRESEHQFRSQPQARHHHED